MHACQDRVRGLLEVPSGLPSLDLAFLVRICPVTDTRVWACSEWAYLSHKKSLWKRSHPSIKSGFCLRQSQQQVDMQKMLLNIEEENEIRTPCKNHFNWYHLLLAIMNSYLFLDSPTVHIRMSQSMRSHFSCGMYVQIYH